MPMTASSPLLRRGATGLALAAALALGACANAPLASAPAGSPAVAAAPQGAESAPAIEVPPSAIGRWYDLGAYDAPWLAGVGPAPARGASVPTRVAGLQRADGQWLALVLVQRVAGGGSSCAAPGRLDVKDAAGCLRMRRDADFDHWLQQQNPVLERWIDARGWAARPRAWISDRATGSGDAVEAVALVNPALLEPVTRNNYDFLVSGGTGQAWARQFAHATQAAAAGGALRVPPFPFSAPLAAPAPAAAPAVVTAPPAATAVQVNPPAPPPARAPRADRQ